MPKLTLLDETRINIYIVEQMSITHSLAQFEQIVMAAILALEDNAYGVTIHAQVMELSGAKKVSLGAVYATLDRLEDKKLIVSWIAGPTRERGGRSRRHYRLEKTGIKALKESVQTSRRVSDAIEQRWGKWKPAR
jgi:DNA-binding PadR family transcriptional regulator